MMPPTDDACRLALLSMLWLFSSLALKDSIDPRDRLWQAERVVLCKIAKDGRPFLSSGKLMRWLKRRLEGCGRCRGREQKGGRVWCYMGVVRRTGGGRGQTR